MATEAGKTGRRRRFSRILGGLLVLLLVGLIGGYWYARPLLLTGTGYAAHNACALSNLTGRPQLNADLPPNPLVPYLVIGDEGAPGEASILGLLDRQQAWFTEGVGCTLAAKPLENVALPPVPTTGNPLAGVATPTASEAVNAALAKAFGDDLDAAGRTKLGTRGIVVLHRGKLVAERYADGFTADTPQLGWSMSKSVTNLLLGRLVLQKAVSVNDDHLRPEWERDGRAAITIDDLARMTSGLAWDETYDLGTPITRMLYLEPDMGGYVASQPLAHQPGSYQQYSSGSTNLLCDVLTERTRSGVNLPRQELFAKLGLSSAVWEPDASGTPVCSSYLWATPRDWAVLGQFALQQGNWNGEQLLPKGWMTESTTVKAVATTEDPGYARGWWVERLPDGTIKDRLLPPDAYWANGHDGQRLYVVPSAELVVVRLGFSPGVGSADLRTMALVQDLITALR